MNGSCGSGESPTRSMSCCSTAAGTRNGRPMPRITATQPSSANPHEGPFLVPSLRRSKLSCRIITFCRLCGTLKRKPCQLWAFCDGAKIKFTHLWPYFKRSFHLKPDSCVNRHPFIFRYCTVLDSTTAYYRRRPSKGSWRCDLPFSISTQPM